MDTAGKVIIKTELDTKDFDKKLDQIDKRIAELQGKAKVEYNDITGDATYTSLRTQEEEEELQRLYELQGEMLLKRQEYNIAQSQALANETQENMLQQQMVENTNQWVDGVMTLNNGLRVVKKDTSELNEEVKKINLNLNKVGGAVTKTTKKIIKWGLALFGIRTAYMFIRSAVNQLAETDPQLKGDLDYMKNVLIYTIEPVIIRLVEWLKTMLLYAGYLIKAWTGIDIFANANKQLKKANKQAKDLKKTLSGFDEANILQDNKSDTGSAGGQLNLKNMEPPAWLKWIKDNSEAIIGLLGGIGTAIAGLKLGLGGLASIIGGAIFVQSFLVFANFLEVIKGIVSFIKDPSWDNFYNIIEHAIKSTGILGYGLVELFRMVFRNGEDLKRFFSTLWESLKGYYLNFYDGFKTVIDNVKRLFKGLYNFLTGTFSGDWKRAWTGLKDIVCSIFNLMANAVRTPLQAMVDMINAIIKGLNSLSINIPDWVPIYGGKKWNIKIAKIPNLPKLELAKGGIVNMPGRGVPIGPAKTGESGAEGVIPLTDSQQMALLGEAIGRYITVNNYVENYMDSRRINRVLQQSRGSDMLANNGGVM